MATDSGAGFVNIEVLCSDPREHRTRVEARPPTVPGLTLPTWRDVLRREYHPWTVDRVVVDTAGRTEHDSLDELLVALSVLDAAPQRPPPAPMSRIRFGHLALPVRDLERSRAWYVDNFGFAVEIDAPERRTVGLKDDRDFTIFLEGHTGDVVPSFSFALEVADVEAKYGELTERGVAFEKSPQRLFWGYGAELRDPDGYLVSVWDERSMREKGGG